MENPSSINTLELIGSEVDNAKFHEMMDLLAEVLCDELDASLS